MRFPPDLTARAPRPDDAEAVYRLVAAAEEVLDGVIDVSLEDIRADWQRPSLDLERDAVLVEDRATPIAYGDVIAGRAWIHVHPDHRRRGVGAALAAWSEERARELDCAGVGQTISDTNLEAIELLRDRGYTPRWSSWLLELELERARDAPPLPDGITLRTLRRPDDERAVYELIDRAFSEWPDREPGEWSFEDWQASLLDRDDTDPELTWLAVDGDEIVGAAVGLVDGDRDGWIQQLAVDRSHRNHGIGRALLQTSFAEFHRRGLVTAGLSTDSRTGALSLYEHVGMRVVRTYRRWSKDL
ncbi:MAG: GNAT family N-acetyltransferase [Actinobacteria bacterium]|nr:GNAT family N-acetyltransferase [Actinomycetota bacterium]